MQKFDISISDNLKVIQLQNHFYMDSVPKIEKDWVNLISQSPEIIAFDCSNLQFIDSSAIGTLVKFFNKAMQQNIKLFFLDVSSPIQDLFKKTKLDNFFYLEKKDSFFENFKNFNRQTSELRTF